MTRAHKLAVLVAAIRWLTSIVLIVIAWGHVHWSVPFFLTLQFVLTEMRIYRLRGMLMVADAKRALWERNRANGVG